MKRTIIFGDIHACHEEWEELIAKLNITPSDRLVALGDLICKGPSSVKTLEIAMNMQNLTCLLGNHEFHFLKAWKEGTLDTMDKGYQRDTVKEMGNALNKFMTFIETWPTYLDLKECTIVHAGIRPNIPLEKQSTEDLVFLRTIGPEQKPWYDFYTQEKLVVHGHWARQGLVQRKNVIGLDTGCVYGKQLTALVLPEREIVQVSAKRAYFPIRS